MAMSRFNPVNALIVLVVGAAGWYGYQVYPYYKDYFQIREATQLAALEYESYGVERAKKKFTDQLDQREVGLYVAEEDCNFYDDKEWNVVECEWAVEIPFPLIDYVKVLRFDTEAAANWAGLED